LGTMPVPAAEHAEAIGHAAAAHADLGELLPLWSCLPFAGMLLSIALMPLLLPRFWHHHYGKVSAFWAASMALPFLWAYRGQASHEIVHIMVADYVPFIILLWSLYTVSGGILLSGRLSGTPLVNTLMLIIGTLLASWMGTTGAAMLMIRPFLRANQHRKQRTFMVVFFIFLVANVGGALTPLGDPPLFLGFLHGVSFFWTLKVLPHMLLTAGVPPSIKVAGQVKRLATVSLTPADCELYARELISSSNGDWDKFLQTNDMDFAATISNLGRFRINLYRQRHSVSITIRRLHERLPSLKELRLPEWIRTYALKPQGLILVSGPAGHGKSTTLCAMIDLINTNRRCNIITLEDPVEYLHKHKKSNINQREIGRDTESFEKGMRAIFRQAPDVIVIGELRDKESFEIALRAARTGCLVISTMNAANSTAVIRMIVNMFPQNQQNLITMLLADALLLSLAQRLVINREKTGVVLALERFTNSNRIANLIREGKLHQIRAQMETGCEEFTPLDLSLAELYKEGRIDFEDGLTYSVNQQLYQDITGIHIK